MAGLRALMDMQRLRIVARLASRPTDANTLAAELRQPIPAIRRHLDVLVAARLVEVQGAGLAGPGAGQAAGPEGFAARPDRVGELARALSAMEREASGLALHGPDGAWPHDGESLADTLAHLEATPEEARILRSFLVDGRLVTIPARGRKRLVVLRFLLERVFTEARDYQEREVNQRLALFHPDVAALRRYLVDEGLADRTAGLYRRRGERPGA